MAIPADFPPVIYVPCIESVAAPEDATVRLRNTRDGRSALLVYSALDRLHTCVGPDEPWLVMPTARLATVREGAPFDLILLDVVVPQSEWAARR